MKKKISFLELLKMMESGNCPESIEYEGDVFIYSSNDEVYRMGANHTVLLEEKIAAECFIYEMFKKQIITIVESVLDEREKRFIREVMVPMRVEEVKKEICIKERGNEERLCYRRNPNFIHVLPPFEKGTMYKGMKPGRWYSVVELLK